jgi:adhesin/invasin
MISVRKLTSVAIASAGLIGATALVSAPAFAVQSHGKDFGGIAISAHRHVVLANGTDKSNISVGLFGSLRGTASAVTLTTTATPSGGTSCGTLGSLTKKHVWRGWHRLHGRLVATYEASSTVGFCTITATDGSFSASTTIDQVDPTLAASHTRYTITSAASPTSIKADGASTSTVTLTVLNGSTPVAGDAIWVRTASGRPGVCGTAALSSPTTGANGQVTITYTASSKPGRCLITSTEASTARSASSVIAQTK